MKRKILVTTLTLMCVFALVVSCATTEPPTPKHAYAGYLAGWNDMMESYRIHYEAQPLEVQAKWRDNINPTLLKVSLALNFWGEDPNSYDKEQAFLTLKREAERLLLTYGIQPKEVE